ncbi:MAG: SURF1 family protein [Comamonadaceae bacterium]|nr:MAG: SURF1 family protein [Comamonadaceae bacterium]
MLILVGIALFLAFLALGTWQVQRRTWKLALIERVDQRVHASPVAAPGPAQWPQIDAAGYEYLPVTLQGRWLQDKTVLTQAATELGAGFWVLTPLQQADGTQVIVNRGFVPPDQRARWVAGTAAGAPGTLPSASTPTAVDAPPATVPVTVQGLLRISEPRGGFLRTNDPAQGRWYSRDVAAIAAAQGLGNAAPYFVDQGLPDLRALPAAAAASAAPVPASGEPRSGMTVIRFANSHAVYALTWYGLALMVVGAAWYVARYERRQRAAHSAPTHDSPR